MLTTLLLLSSAALGSNDVCADRAALARPAAEGALTPEQDRCLQQVVDRGAPEDSVDAAMLLWRHLRATASEDERRFKALRAVLDRSAPRGSAMFFAKGHVGERLLVDGVDIGAAPARVAALAEGPHVVEIQSPQGAITRDIEFEIRDQTTIVNLP